MHTKLALFLCGLLILFVIVTGCNSSEATEPVKTTEEEDITYLDVKSSIAEWIPDNVDDVSRTIGALVTADVPVAGEIATAAIKTALLMEFQLSVKHTRPIEGEDKYSARVALEFPLLLELPALGEKMYWVEASYDFIIENCKVIEADIDTASFEIKEVNN